MPLRFAKIPIPYRMSGYVSEIPKRGVPKTSMYTTSSSVQINSIYQKFSDIRHVMKFRKAEDMKSQLTFRKFYLNHNLCYLLFYYICMYLLSLM